MFYKQCSIYKIHLRIDTFNNIHGLEPGWLGASFGLRNSYVRIIITRYMVETKLYKYIVMYLICNVLIHNFIFF
jgi:hypothetical protein